MKRIQPISIRCSSICASAGPGGRARIRSSTSPIIAGSAARPSPPDADPLADYLVHGVHLEYLAPPVFDRRFYLDQYGDIRASGADPFLHYVHYGDREGRQPNPLFDPVFLSRAQPCADAGRQARPRALRAARARAGPAHACAVRHRALPPQLPRHPRCGDRAACSISSRMAATSAGRHIRCSTREYLLEHAPEITKRHPNAVIAFLGSSQRQTASPTPVLRPALLRRASPGGRRASGRPLHALSAGRLAAGPQPASALPHELTISPSSSVPGSDCPRAIRSRITC